MQTQFETTKLARGRALDIIKDLSDEQLLSIPEGFSNNILWNLGHIVVAHQYLVYKLSGLDMVVPQSMVTSFIGGTSPKDWESTPNIAELKTLVMSTMEQFEADIKANKFQNYEGLDVGKQLETTEDAATYNCLHEGEHIGVIKSLARLV